MKILCIVRTEQHPSVSIAPHSVNALCICQFAANLGLVSSSASANSNNGSSGGIGHVFYAGLPDELVDLLRLDPHAAAEPGVPHSVLNGDSSPLVSAESGSMFEVRGECVL